MGTEGFFLFSPKSFNSFHPDCAFFFAKLSVHFQFLKPKQRLQLILNSLLGGRMMMMMMMMMMVAWGVWEVHRGAHGQVVQEALHCRLAWFFVVFVNMVFLLPTLLFVDQLKFFSGQSWALSVFFGFLQNRKYLFLSNYNSLTYFCAISI